VRYKSGDAIPNNASAGTVPASSIMNKTYKTLGHFHLVVYTKLGNRKQNILLAELVQRVDEAILAIGRLTMVLTDIAVAVAIVGLSTSSCWLKLHIYIEGWKGFLDGRRPAL
jgi:hypothetical protein